ncbi:MAG: MFS transporter [Acidimicrobiales bacterium]
MADPRQVSIPDHVVVDADAPTEPTPALGQGDRPGLHVRMFGSPQFFHLWLTQVVSATGDWLGFLAIAALAARISDHPERAIGFVMSARIVPGLFLGAASGVVADRFDRKRVMVTCDLGRAAVLATLPFVDTVFGLVVASLVLEGFTMLWTPAKEASVPNLVPPEHLTTANSLSLVAAYGTMPVAAGLFSLLAKVSDAIGGIDALDVLRTNQEGVAFYADALTFVFSALMISRLTLPKARVRQKQADAPRIDFGQAFHELKEGWHFIFINPVARAVNVGLATGLIGGGMLVPLGPVFSDQILGAGTAGFGLFIFALGCGVAVGVVLLSLFQRRLPKAQVFAGSVIGAGTSLVIAASLASLAASAFFVALLGVCAGSVYVLGFTLLHESVDDELRGRIFSALYTLVRFCVLIAFAVGPFLSDLLDRLSVRLFERHVAWGEVDIFIPGVRLTLWLAGLIIIGAGVLAVLSLRAGASPTPDGERLQELMSDVTRPFSDIRESRDRSGPQP